jgi:phosphoribosylaminoimidazolecarboxamide formyltransferase/IMP cyclohydrolase
VRVLLSVYDKTGLVDLASGLVALGHDLVASGGTATALADAGLPHVTVESVTGAPEMLGGRVKTLHPGIHGGILADRTKLEHLADLARQGIGPIGLVVCNLYPFRSNPSIELIDVGGPTMVRAAAKNWAHVGSLVDPADYAEVLAELRRDGMLSDGLRRRLARAAFAHTAAYDAAITTWFDESASTLDDPAVPDAPGTASPGTASPGTASPGTASPGTASPGTADASSLPASIHLAIERVQSLRYGENPHQHGARYREVGGHSWWDDVEQHSGLALSYLNLYDADSAWRLAHQLADLGPAAAVVVKHANPCGAAVADDVATAYDQAFACDPMSAFGGIVALTAEVSLAVAEDLVANPKADVLIAPAYAPEALDLLAAKRKNMRVLSAPAPTADRWNLRQISGGWLVQQPYVLAAGRADWRVVTEAQPTESNWVDLELAWRVCAAVKSNAIVLAAGGVAYGIGGGQPNRVTPGELAAGRAAGRAAGGAAASDAFFPFRDGLDAAAAAGVAAVIQPGGSLRDPEVIAAADEHGLVMVFTGERQFQH